MNNEIYDSKEYKFMFWAFDNFQDSLGVKLNLTSQWVKQKNTCSK